jgi:vacuolar-type H+-ATPase subunit I/STV1
MRMQFEERFDQIRRENEELVKSVRARRDECAQRVCDVLDEQAEVTDIITSFHEELAKLNLEESRLSKEVAALTSLESDLIERVRLVDSTYEEVRAECESELSRIADRKSQLRDEIRDLTGYIAMSKRVSDVGGEGGTILATQRRKHRR